MEEIVDLPIPLSSVAKNVIVPVIVAQLITIGFLAGTRIVARKVKQKRYQQRIQSQSE